jgi:sugar/nucleoside kinase (ribokinase family)
VNRTEAELCLRERGLPLAQLVERMGRLLNVPALSVTDGESGAMVLQHGAAFAIPTVSARVIDTVGCGDAYFALSSLAAAMHCPPGIVALTGSIGAAAVAQRRGNESATSDQEFLTIGKIVI